MSPQGDRSAIEARRSERHRAGGGTATAARTRAALSGVVVLLAMPGPIDRARAQDRVGTIDPVALLKASASAGSLSTAAPGAASGPVFVPARVLVCSSCSDEGAAQTALTAPYASATPQADGGILATAVVTTPAGSAFRFEDRYHAGARAGTLTLDRTVTVAAVGAGDRGFNTQLLIGFGNGKPIAASRFFAPGIWYGDDRNAGGTFGTFETDPNADTASWLEYLSGIPLVSMQDVQSGLSLGLAHVGSIPTADGTEAETSWLVDPAVQYGSLSIQKTPEPSIGFTYPGEATKGTSSVRRSHPVRLGFVQHYTLLLAIGLNDAGDADANYNASLAQTWRLYYDVFDPTPVGIPVDAVFDAGISLFSANSQDFNGAQGLPFTASLATDRPIGISYQMGYTGEQIPAGFELLRDGMLRGRQTEFLQGEAMLDFWASRAAQPSGLPLTWYNVTPPTFRNTATRSPLFLRSLTDGMEGMVEAALFLREQGKPRPAWEHFASAFGDWLVRNQNADGSYYRYYAPDGSVFVVTGSDAPADRLGFSKANSTNPIRFLVELYFATGQQRYLNAALAAGRYSLGAIIRPAQYVGGHFSAPAVLDREAGSEAIHAMLALYDATRDSVWLDAARNAADFTETWLYGWTFPLGGNSAAYLHSGSRGFSLTSTGSTAAGIFLSFESYDYYRLHLLGDDPGNHYLRVATLLQDDSKLTTQLAGVPGQDFGYARSGLVSEAVSFATLAVEEPTHQWLPWLTEAELEPLRQMDSTFGTRSIEQAEAQPLARRMFENAHVYPAPGSLGWEADAAPAPTPTP